MSKPLLLILEANERGHAILDGRSYRVRGYVHNQRFQVGDHSSVTLDVHLVMEESLDEQRQLLKIQGLETALARERDKLEEMRVILHGEADETAAEDAV